MRLEYLKQGRCPECFALIPHPAVVNITLNNGTVMQQPMCEAHFELMLTEAGQKELLSLCKLIWIAEINSSEQRTADEKKKEVERINKLEVVYNG